MAIKGLKSMQLANNPSVPTPKFNFREYVIGQSYRNNLTDIDFVTYNGSLYVCTSSTGVTATQSDPEENGDFLLLVAKGQDGQQGRQGRDGAPGRMPEIGARFNGTQLEIFDSTGTRLATSPNLAGKAWRPVKNGTKISWELSRDNTVPSDIDLDELRPEETRPLLLRVDSDNTKRSDEESGPANMIQWKHEGDAKWTNLISIAELMNLTLAGVSVWVDEDTNKWHFGHREVIKAQYESNHEGQRIISHVELGNILFDAGELPFANYEVDFTEINRRLTALENAVPEVDLSNYFTKSESDARYLKKNEIPDVELDDVVKTITVNGTVKHPVNGNISITIGDNSTCLKRIQISNGTLYQTWDGTTYEPVGSVGGNSESNVDLTDIQLRVGDYSNTSERNHIFISYDHGRTWVDLGQFIDTDTQAELTGYATIRFVTDNYYSKTEVDNLLANIDDLDLTTYRTFTIYTRNNDMNTPPALPNDGISATWDLANGVLVLPQDYTAWTNHPENATAEKPYLWMASATFQSKNGGSRVSDWDGPFCLTGAQGPGGSNGADGKGVEFIYHLGNLQKPEINQLYYKKDNVEHTLTVETSAAFWASDSSRDCLPSDGNGSYWTDNPTGIDDVDGERIEWARVRRSSPNAVTGVSEWSDFSDAFIWSMWGEDGMDGDGVEYIFCVTASIDEQPAISALIPRIGQTYEDFDNSFPNYQEDDWYPKDGQGNANRWTDNPLDVSERQPYEWVAIRKYDGATHQWGYFSEPKVWGLWGTTTVYQSSVAPIYQPYTCWAFTRSNVVNFDKNYIVKTTWEELGISYDTWIGADPTRETAFYNNPLNFLITKRKNGDSWVEDSTVIWTDSIPAGTAPVYMISNHIGDESEEETSWDGPFKWGDQAGFQVEYAVSDEKTDLVYSHTKVLPKLSKKVGGAYRYITNDPLRDTDGDGIDESLWREDVLDEMGVWGDENDVVEPDYMAMCIKQANGEWSDWQIVRIKGERGAQGPIGPNGRDGGNVEFVFYRTKGTEVPGCNATYGTYDGVNRIQEEIHTEGFLPEVTGVIDSQTLQTEGSFWHNHPTGVDETYTREYVAMRSYVLGPSDIRYWTSFNVALWSQFGKRGTDGDGVEYVFFALTKSQHDYVQNYEWQAGLSQYEGKIPVDNAAIANDANGDPTVEEFLPYTSMPGWTTQLRASDNNPGGTDEKPYVYCTKRKYNGQSRTWMPFGPASLWVAIEKPTTNYGTFELSDDSETILIDSSNNKLLQNTVYQITRYKSSWLYYDTQLVDVKHLYIDGVRLGSFDQYGFNASGSVVTKTIQQKINGVDTNVSFTIIGHDRVSSNIRDSLAFDFYLTYQFLTEYLAEPIVIPITVAGDNYEGTALFKILPTTENDTEIGISWNNVCLTSTRGSKDYHGTTHYEWSVNKTYNSALDTNFLYQYWFSFDGNAPIKFDPDVFLTQANKNYLRGLESAVHEQGQDSSSFFVWFDKSGNKLDTSTDISTHPANYYFYWWIRQNYVGNSGDLGVTWKSSMNVELSAYSSDETDYPIDYITLGVGANDTLVQTEDIAIIYNGKNGTSITLESAETPANVTSLSISNDRLTVTTEEEETQNLDVSVANSVAKTVDAEMLNWYAGASTIEDEYEPDEIIGANKIKGFVKGSTYINVYKLGDSEASVLGVSLDLEKLVKEISDRLSATMVIQDITAVDSNGDSVLGKKVTEGDEITISGQLISITGLYQDLSFTTQATIDTSGTIPTCIGYAHGGEIEITTSAGKSRIIIVPRNNAIPRPPVTIPVAVRTFVNCESGFAYVACTHPDATGAENVSCTFYFSQPVRIIEVEADSESPLIPQNKQSEFTLNLIENGEPNDIYPEFTILFDDIEENTLMYCYTSVAIAFAGEEPTVYTSAKKYFKTTVSN